MLNIDCPTPLTHFEQDDHTILLDVMAHVETNISLFQTALQNTHNLLPKVVHFQVTPFESLMVQSCP